MGYYKVLSLPIFDLECPHYRGLYRVEPPGSDKASNEYINLWQRYVEHYGDGGMGISTQMSVKELQALAVLCKQMTGNDFEVIWFDTERNCPYPSTYYGIDVVGVGGYSLLGEGLFSVNDNTMAMAKRFEELNRFYTAQLNENGLFNNIDIAEKFCQTLRWLNKHLEGIIETEEWHTVYVYRLE